jgi:class 3 adenylate cyclase
MSDVPTTQYALSAEGRSFAYQVFGASPRVLMVEAGIPTPIDLMWDEPGLVRARDRLTTFSRNIWAERRGWGSSERDLSPELGISGAAVDEELSATLDAVGAEQVAMFAGGFAGPGAIHYVAAHPERVSTLVLYGTYASYVRDAECPWGVPSETKDRLVAAAREVWGTGAMADVVAPSRRDDDRFREWLGRCERLASNPAYAAERIRVLFEQDVRRLLAQITVPTLVVHRRDDRYIRVEAGRHLAEHIVGAKYVELPGEDHFFFVGDADALIDEVEEYLTGIRTGREGNVVVSTVLFTDIIGSTRHEAAIGRREWSKLTAQHDVDVRAALHRHRGHEVKTIGDGFLATFDGAGRAVRCAAEIVRRAREIGLDVRTGVHTGEVEFRDNDVAGLAVNIAKRVCDLASGARILVTETVRGSVVGSDLEFDDQGEHELKGVPGTWRLFALDA